MKILTISIAAYNVEKFLDKTLSSLCNERLSEDLEVLIIDDDEPITNVRVGGTGSTGR